MADRPELRGGDIWIGDQRLSDLVDALGGYTMKPFRVMDQAYMSVEEGETASGVTADPQVVALDAARIVTEALRDEQRPA